MSSKERKEEPFGALPEYDRVNVWRWKLPHSWVVVTTITFGDTDQYDVLVLLGREWEWTEGREERRWL